MPLYLPQQHRFSKLYFMFYTAKSLPVRILRNWDGSVRSTRSDPYMFCTWWYWKLESKYCRSYTSLLAVMSFSATHTPQHASLQKGWLPVSSSLECGSHLGSILSSLPLPHPTHPLLLQLVIVFTGKAVLFLVKPDLQSLGYSLALFWIWTLSQPCSCRAGTQPAHPQPVPVESWGDQGRAIKQTHAFYFLHTWCGQSSWSTRSKSSCSWWF